MVMMQYSVMANNYWLLVEGIYLHSLLVITVFSEKKYFYVYLAIGWGKNHICYTHILKLSLCRSFFPKSIIRHEIVNLVVVVCAWVCL